MQENVNNIDHKDVFICYRHKYDNDKQEQSELNNLFPDYICEVLSKDYKVYYDSQTPAKGKTLNAIEKIIDKCTDFVIIVEEHTFNRIVDVKDIDYVKYELSYAYDKGKNIIPIFRDWSVFSKLRSRDGIADEIAKLKVFTPFIVRDTTGMGDNAEFIRLSIKNYLYSSKKFKSCLSKNKKRMLGLIIAIPTMAIIEIILQQWFADMKLLFVLINSLVIGCSLLAAYIIVKKQI